MIFFRSRFFKISDIKIIKIFVIIYFREDIIADTLDNYLDELRWHTSWECDILSSISKQIESQNDNDNDESVLEQVSVSKEESTLKLETKTNGGLYNLVFPLRFIALKSRSPHLYKQLLDLECHLTERKFQVIFLQLQILHCFLIIKF